MNITQHMSCQSYVTIYLNSQTLKKNLENFKIMCTFYVEKRPISHSMPNHISFIIVTSLFKVQKVIFSHKFLHFFSPIASLLKRLVVYFRITKVSLK